jgi:hypothetical protein
MHHECLAKIKKIVIPAGFKPESGFYMPKNRIPERSIRG